MKGIFVDVMHASTCPLWKAPPAERRDPMNVNRKHRSRRRCSCTPRVRIRLRSREPWWSAGPWELSIDWTAEQVDELEELARNERRVIDAGLKVGAPRTRREVPTVAEWGRERLATIRSAIERDAFLPAEERSAFSPNTLVAYTGNFTKHVAPRRSEGGIGDMRLTAVTYETLRDLRVHLLTEKKLARSTADGVIYMLSAWFKLALAEAEEHGWPITSNPAKVPSRKSEGTRQRSRSRAQTQQASKAMPLEIAKALLRKHQATEFGEILLTAVTTGMRVGELVGVKKEHLYLADRYLEVAGQRRRGLTAVAEDSDPKYESFRYAPIYWPLAQMWMPYDGDEGYLFVDHNQRDVGGPWQTRKLAVMMAEEWDAVVAEHGDRFKERRTGRGEGQGWHACRHLFSNLLDQSRDVSPRVRRAIMGHGSGSKMTQTYTHVEPDELTAVQAVLEEKFGDVAQEFAATRKAMRVADSELHRAMRPV